MLVDGWATEFFGGGNNRPTFPFIAIPKEDCVGSSPTVKKRIASFLVPGYSREPRHANRVRGFLLFFGKKLASKRHLFRSLVPGRARSRTRSGLFSCLCKKAPALMACVFFRSLFAGKARHCGAVKNFF